MHLALCTMPLYYLSKQLDVATGREHGSGFVLPGQAAQRKASRGDARQGKPSRCVGQARRERCPLVLKNTVSPILAVWLLNECFGWHENRLFLLVFPISALILCQISSHLPHGTPKLWRYDVTLFFNEILKLQMLYIVDYVHHCQTQTVFLVSVVKYDSDEHLLTSWTLTMANEISQYLQS